MNEILLNILSSGIIINIHEPSIVKTPNIILLLGIKKRVTKVTLFYIKN